ncbi:MAG: ABC transporter ATP-binding protein [Bacteroidetes bacterium]|nr:ABC transporter ATP-binding protein [Bacteroidota bacterium]
MSAISVKGITKTYISSATPAVDRFSFDVSGGELFGLIGPDGAGKTTLFRILTTLLLPDSGTATVDGCDIIRDYAVIRTRVGYMPGRFSLYQDLTVKENINFFATVFGTTLKENYSLIKDIYVQLEPFIKRKAGKLSGGMKQKLALCCALIHKPVVLFLDEPTTGVDAVSRKEFWAMLRRLKEEGITILVSTPYMDEAMICERIALVQSGKILSVDTPANIVKSYPGKLFAVRSGSMYRLLNDLRSYKDTGTCFAFGEYLHVSFIADDENRQRLITGYLAERGHTNIEIKPAEPSIEDCFIKLMKN